MEIHGRLEVRRHRVLVPTWVAKTVMAVTGLVMAAFVVVHMLGNLKVLVDPEGMDAYAAWLREAFEPVLPREGLLWIFRITLAVCLVLHVAFALVLWRRGRATRTRGASRLAARGVSARWMLPTGVLLLLFVVVHILDLTVGRWVEAPGFRHPDPSFHAAANVAASLGRPLMAAFYLLVLLALTLHLAHGIQLAWQDLGGSGPRGRAVAKVVAHAVAIVVLVGDGAVVIAAWTGVL